MKKTIFILVLFMIISFYSCSGQSNTSLDYYSGMDIPTFESITGKVQCISSGTNFSFGYGEFDSLEEAKSSMILYCEFLKNKYDYNYEVFSDYYARVETKYGTVVLASMISQKSSIIVAISLPE